MSETKKGGVKYDQGKTPVTLIPSEVFLGIADVMGFGMGKYGRCNWAKGIDFSRLSDAAFRHLLAFQKGEDKDPESGHSHLLHSMVNLAFLYYFTLHRPDLDDRWEGKEQK